MKDLEFILSVMVTNDIGGYFPGYSELESYIERYNDNYSRRDTTIKEFNNINEFFNSIELPEDQFG
jgi:hypothetical protein